MVQIDELHRSELHELRTVGLLVAIGVVGFGGVSMFEWKIQGGNWGNYWGIDEEGWITVWATFISATIAATVAISVLWGQNKHLAKLAASDRTHQAEEARIPRNIEATLTLNEDLDAYLSAADALYEYANGWLKDIPAHLADPSVDARYRKLKSSIHRWSSNSGLESYQYRAVVSVMIEEARHYILEHPSAYIDTEPDLGSHLRQMVEEIMLHLQTPGNRMWEVMEKHVKYYDQQIQPKITKLDDKNRAHYYK